MDLQLNEWQTKDGKIIKIADMETSHIKNCINWLERKLLEKPEHMIYMGQSEYAEAAVESENEHNQQVYQEALDKIEIFKNELKKRNKNA